MWLQRVLVGSRTLLGASSNTLPCHPTKFGLLFDLA